MTTVPTEKIEQQVFVETAKILGCEVFAIYNENSIKNPGFFQRRKKSGWQKGIADLFVIVPAEKSITEKNCGLFIEMKRKNPILKNGKIGKSPSKVCDEQIEFIKKINGIDGVQGKICFGEEDATNFLKQFLK